MRGAFVAALPQTSDDLLRLIDRSGLIPLEKVQQRLGGQKAPPMARPLAQWLVKSGLLTTFQAEQILQGKSRGFFLGNYRVLERLGGGATAGVFLCEHRVMRHRVAVKVLDQRLLEDDLNNLLRFRREARAAAALSHPNIVRTMDLDEDSGRHFLVMEYVEGQTLDQWLKANTAAPPRAFASFILQAAQGLSHIHESGLIHRDLKPGNFLIDKQGTVKILDLGLAKFTEDTADALSKVQGANIMGTVDFMSPEQADGSQQLDIRSDIYSLGATLYYLLTGGQVPFRGATLGAKMIAIQFQKPKRIADYRPDVDARLEKIVERMMARDPADRFQTPLEVIEALQRWINSPNKPARKTAAPTDTRVDLSWRKKTRAENGVPLAEAADETTARRTRVKSSDRTRLWLLRGAFLLLIVGGLMIWKPWRSNHKVVAQAQVTIAPE